MGCLGAHLARPGGLRWTQDPFWEPFWTPNGSQMGVWGVPKRSQNQEDRSKIFHCFFIQFFKPFAAPRALQMLFGPELELFS